MKTIEITEAVAASIVRLAEQIVANGIFDAEGPITAPSEPSVAVTVPSAPSVPTLSLIHI